VTAGLAWAAFTYFSDEIYAAAAMAVGFVVGWAVRRPTTMASPSPLFGVVAAGLAVAGVLLGWIVFDIAQIAKVNHLDLLTAAKSVGDTEAGWGQVLRDPFASPLDWVFFALAIFVAFGAAARSSRPGQASQVTALPQLGFCWRISWVLSSWRDARGLPPILIIPIPTRRAGRWRIAAWNRVRDLEMTKIAADS
jgi:hypothetical protein